MQDSKYCYPNSNVLINKFDITDCKKIFEIEKRITAIRLSELQDAPIKGNFDFAHLKAIHKHIFQDLYEWAGKERTVEIGKGNTFCMTHCIQEYAESIFEKYFPQCYATRNDFDKFVKVFADNYGDLNALHPFREGNGRTQREFAREVCLECGYDFDLSCTTHQEMLKASKLSFNMGDNSLFVKIFSEAITPYNPRIANKQDVLHILTADDLSIGLEECETEQSTHKKKKQTEYDV